jgi:hypothetical protein
LLTTVFAEQVAAKAVSAANIANKYLGRRDNIVFPPEYLLPQSPVRTSAHTLKDGIRVWAKMHADRGAASMVCL